MHTQTRAAERLESGPLVEALIEQQQVQVQSLLNVPELAIVTTLGDDPSIQSYFARKRAHADKIGVNFVDHGMPEEAEAMQKIYELNHDGGIHGIVPQLPFKDPSWTQGLCDAVAEHKDVDALSEAGREFFDPPTAKAVVELARHHTNDFEGIDPERVAVVGALGRLVGTGTVKLLQREGLEPIQIDAKLGNQEELEKIGRKADLVITATGSPASITPQHLKRDHRTDLPITIIDGGIGTIESQDGTVRRHQDLHQEVFDLPYVRATGLTKAVGPLAVAYMIGNVCDAAQMQQN